MHFLRVERTYKQGKRVNLSEDFGDRKAVTVCIAALFRWPYPNGEGYAALAITDRMITFGDVQYEPSQTKVANVTSNIILMIAGDYSVHSQAIRRTLARFKGDQKAAPEQVAAFYGRAIQLACTRFG